MARNKRRSRAPKVASAAASSSVMVARTRPDREYKKVRAGNEPVTLTSLE